MTMTKTTLAVAGAILLSATPAFAQKGGVLVVDTDRVLNDCTACKAAGTQLQSQANQLRQRAQQREAQLKPEAARGAGMSEKRPRCLVYFFSVFLGRSTAWIFGRT